MSRAPGGGRARGAALALAAVVLVAGGCGTRAPRPPRITLVNGSGLELRDVSFFGERGPVAPTVDVLAAGDSTAAELAIAGEDAVFVSYLAGGRACVSDDSAYVEPERPRHVRFVVDSALRARVVGSTLGR